MSFDLVIANGHILDGTGNPWFKADVGIRGGKIARIARIERKDAGRIVDARGLIVSPGFIDIHNHSDITLLINPKSESMVRQGITTIVVGNCGISAAPLSKIKLGRVLEWTLFKDVLGAGSVEEIGLRIDWLSFAEYLSKLEEQGVAINVASLVGHGTLRLAVMNECEGNSSTGEIEEMKSLVNEAMREGAFGLSTGLVYFPGRFADTSEIVELSGIVKNYDGLYVSHIRNDYDHVVEAVAEAIEIGQKAGVAVQISHMHAKGRQIWKRNIRKVLQMIEDARTKDVDVLFDVIFPYTTWGMTSYPLSSLLPTWAVQDGTQKMLERLRDPEAREKMKKDMESSEWTDYLKPPLNIHGWKGVILVYCRKNKDLEGMTIEEIAKSRKVDPYDFTFDLLLEEGDDVEVMRTGLWCEDVIIAAQQHNLAIATGSDGIALAPYGILGKIKANPRSYGSFPRFLGKFVRERKVLSLEEAIRKITSLPAQRMRIRDRGLIAEGMWADITIFDPTRILDRSTPVNPHQYPEGIEYVIVNGELVVDKGRHTGTLPGKPLRHFVG